jgi:hypothetical protein
MPPVLSPPTSLIDNDIDSAPVRAVTWRSFIAGTIGAILICGLTPYNDFVLSDTSLSAGFLPLGAVLIMFLLIVAVNAPLHRWRPSSALTTPELAVVTLMVLVASSIPNWGLMRFFIPTPVAPFRLGASDPQFWSTFTGMNLPRWLFPVSDIRTGRTDPIAVWFYTRIPHGEHITWSAWIAPLFAWGIFAAAMLATLAAMARLVLDQWMTNERLPLPLLQVQSALIDPPEPGFSLNSLFRSRGFWIALIAVFAVHSLNALHAYDTRHFPRISLGFDLTRIFADEPFVYLRPKAKAAIVSFMIVGATYFIRSRVAFSLWFIYLLSNLVDVREGMRQTTLPPEAWADVHLGACTAFIGAIAWIGRHHWLTIFKNAVGLSPQRTYRLSFWIVVVGIAIMFTWLCVLGVHAWLAGLIVLFILAAHLVVSRVVAETGLPFYRTYISSSQIYTNLSPALFHARDIFFAQVFTVLGPQTTRDSLMSFALHGQGVCERAGVDRNNFRRIGLVIAWTLIIGSLVAGAMTLHCQYSYPTPMTRDILPQGNNFGSVYVPQRDIANPLDTFSRGRFAPKPYSPAVAGGIGFFATLLLEFASLRYASWPLLPVGIVASHGAIMENAWFSIFVGWLAKSLIVRLGGSSLFTQAKPIFVGIIFGEALAAGFWLAINAIIVTNGGVSQPIRFLL